MSLGPACPHWRWARVVEISNGSYHQVLGLLSREDKKTRTLYDFKREMDTSPEIRFPSYFAAHSIYQTSPALRLAVEGYLLTGASSAEIAEDADCDPEDIDVYHDCFFDVRGRLSKKAWLCYALFQGLPHRGCHLNDQLGLMHRIAVFGGLDFVKAYLAHGLTHEVRENLIEMAKDMMSKMTLELALSGSIRQDQVEVVRIALEKPKGEGAGGGLSPEFETALTSFVEAMSLSVADPTNEHNLSLPARERRAREYEAEVISVEKG